MSNRAPGSYTSFSTSTSDADFAVKKKKYDYLLSVSVNCFDNSYHTYTTSYSNSVSPQDSQTVHSYTLGAVYFESDIALTDGGDVDVLHSTVYDRLGFTFLAPLGTPAKLANGNRTINFPSVVFTNTSNPTGSGQPAMGPVMPIPEYTDEIMFVSSIIPERAFYASGKSEPVSLQSPVSRQILGIPMGGLYGDYTQFLPPYDVFVTGFGTKIALVGGATADAVFSDVYGNSGSAQTTLKIFHKV